MIKKLDKYLLDKKGMTLVEVLTAFSILALMIFCFAPLMLSYLNTVTISGKAMERVYDKASALEVLLGNQASKTGYTVALNSVPLQLHSPDANVTVNGSTQNIAAATVNSFVKAYGISSGGTFEKDPSTGLPTVLILFVRDESKMTWRLLAQGSGKADLPFTQSGKSVWVSQVLGGNQSLVLN